MKYNYQISGYSAIGADDNAESIPKKIDSVAISDFSIMDKAKSAKAAFEKYYGIDDPDDWDRIIWTRHNGAWYAADPTETATGWRIVRVHG